MRSLLIFLLLIVIGCSRTEDTISTTPTCKIISARQLNYVFDDVQLSKTFFDPSFTKFSFEYDSQNRISKINGGLMATTSNGTLGYFFATSSVYDELSYSGNTVFVKVSANQPDRPYDKEFVIENGKIVSQKITSLYPFPNSIPINFSYVYSGNTVIERYNGILNNRINKTFEIENDNLSKITKWKYDSNGNINGKTEIIFSSYDNQENMLKGKFFVNGAFYMAFSKNIWNDMDSKSYNLENGNYVANGEYYHLVYTPSVTVNYFEKKCN